MNRYKILSKYFFVSIFLLLYNAKIFAQFTICDKCGEQRQGNALIIEGAGKGTWTVKYNLMGHTTSFTAANGEKIILKSSGGNKTEAPNGLTTRRTTSEDGVWQAEVVYNGKTFIKATLTKQN